MTGRTISTGSRTPAAATSSRGGELAVGEADLPRHAVPVDDPPEAGAERVLADGHRHRAVGGDPVEQAAHLLRVVAAHEDRRRRREVEAVPDRAGRTR